MIIDKFGIREQNEAIVLQTVIRNENISRVEISNLTHLNKASVSQIAQKLIETDLITEIGSGDAGTSGGRKPIQLKFNGQCGVAIAFDIGYNYLNGQVTYIDGTLITERHRTDLPINQDNVLKAIDEMMREFLAAIPETTYGVTGIALAIHGIVKNQEIIFTPYYNLAGKDLRTPLEETYQVPIYLENEANLTAFGEYCFVAAQQQLISLSIHSGIGAGIITTGKLQIGDHGFAGEVGHSILIPNGLACPCGNRGCIEKYASNKALFDQFSEAKNLPYVNSDIFVEAYQSGDELARSLAAENVLYLSIAINNLVVLWDPEVVIINSSVYRKLPQLIDEMQQHFTSRFTREINVTNSQLGEQAPLYGGIAIVAKHFLNIDDLKFPLVITNHE